MIIPIIPIATETEKIGLHPCPYHIEINDDYEYLCDCDDEQQAERIANI